MSTTVTYKGSTLTTVNNNTKTLKTAGKYMEGDVVLTDVSGGTAAISVVDTTDSHGGTVREITALDISDTTAVASDVASGKYFYTSAGVKTAGTATGGSGGLEYETGTLTLSSDENTPIISFTNTHTDVPIYINITDVTETLATDNSNLYWTFMNWYTLNDSFIKTTSSANLYGRYQYGWKTSSGASAGNIDCTNTGTGSGSLYYLVTEDRFGPYCGGTSRYWRAGRTYKWIAVWKPVDPADIPLNVQLIDYTKVISGYVVDGDTGQETASQWSSCSDYVLIDSTMTFSYIGYRWYDIVFFDSNKGYISSLYMDDDKDSVTNDYANGTITPAKIPSTAKYVRISSYPTNPNNTQLSLIRTA